MVVAALIFAMAGGAYAASSGKHKHGRHGHMSKKHKGSKVKITSTKQISAKVLKQLRGNVGPVGPTGAAGPVGPAGKDGTNGAPGGAGANGKSVAVSSSASGCAEGGITVEVEGSGTPNEVCNGAKGATGGDGKSVAVSSSASGCAEGGITVEVEGSGTPNEVCNGAKGATGANGSPWTAGGVLPKEKAEVGTWVYRGSTENGAVGSTAISFTIPLASAPAGQEFLYAKETGAHCTGSAAAPTAPVGYLCVYDAWEKEFYGHPITGVFQGFNNGEAFNGTGAGRFGALVNFVTEHVGEPENPLPTAVAEGTWAVTGNE